MVFIVIVVVLFPREGYISALHCISPAEPTTLTLHAYCLAMEQSWILLITRERCVCSCSVMFMLCKLARCSHYMIAVCMVILC